MLAGLVATLVEKYRLLCCTAAVVGAGVVVGVADSLV